MKIIIDNNHWDGNQKPVFTIDTENCTYPYAIRDAIRQALVLDGLSVEDVNEVFGEMSDKVVENPICEKDDTILRLYRAGVLCGQSGGMLTSFKTDADPLHQKAFSMGVSDVPLTAIPSDEEILERVYSKIDYPKLSSQFIGKLAAESVESFEKAWDSVLQGNPTQMGDGLFCKQLKPGYKTYLDDRTREVVMAIKINSLEDFNIARECFPSDLMSPNSFEIFCYMVVKPTDSERIRIEKGSWLVVTSGPSDTPMFRGFSDEEFRKNFTKVKV